ncbi:MAG: hypothetical protein H6747_09625 [Deltaproteobacteria bacterium]|nr:hypothetical protein [Deltaproteobacteria bacterium]
MTEPVKTDNQTPEPAPAPAPASTPEGGKENETQVSNRHSGSDLAALKAELEAAKAELAKAKDGMSDADKMREQIENLKTDLNATKADALAHARSTALDALGVLAEYREFAPADADPRTAEGKAALEEWASKRPAILSRRGVEAPKVDVDSSSIFGESGKGNPFISPKSFSDMAKKLGLN